MTPKINKITINDFRRRVMFALTKNVGNRRPLEPTESLDVDKVKTVLVLRPNHRLGNLLLTTPLIEEISNTFPNCSIDILVKGDYLAPIVFGNYTSVRAYLALPRKPFNELIKYIRLWIKVKFSRYDMVINAVEGSSSGRLLTKLAISKHKIFGGSPENNEVPFANRDHIAIGPIYDLRYYLSKIVPMTDEYLPPLDLKLTVSEIEQGASILKSIVNDDRPVLAIFTFATGTKCYSTEWWRTFYERLKVEFPEYKILEILPIENVSQIQFEATTYYSKEIREIASVMHNTEVFIGADSGMMHLAAAALTPTIGLFSKPNIHEYKPYGPNNFPIDTNTTSLDESMALIRRVLH
ncbi:glycosyltransferase family 9 protein [Psychroserpens sp. BH13MA-6]